MAQVILFLQQLLNGLSLGSIYALFALGYTMVYGVLRFINFAHGDVYMLGTYAGFAITNTHTPTGWVAGAGVEWGFAPRWTARVEYLHLDLEGTTWGFTSPLGPGGIAGTGVFAVNESRRTIDTVRAGVNFLFN